MWTDVAGLEDTFGRRLLPSHPHRSDGGVMPGQQSRLERRPEAANSLAADTTITETIAVFEYFEAERPRCLRCGHPITVARSVSRA